MAMMKLPIVSVGCHGWERSADIATPACSLVHPMHPCLGTGTQANKEKKYEQGQTGYDNTPGYGGSSTGTQSGTGYGQGTHSGSGGVSSKIPGTCLLLCLRCGHYIVVHLRCH